MVVEKWFISFFIYICKKYFGLKPSPFKIFVVFGLLACLGFFLLPMLSVRLNPSQRLPTLSVSYNWPNTSPYNLERQITSKLETGFSTIRGLQKIDSKSSKGFGYITLGFDKEIPLESARFEVATIIRQIYPNLPENASYPEITLNDPDDLEAKPFLSYSIYGRQSAFAIRKIVKTQIDPIIGTIKGVGSTQVYGATDKEYLITYDPEVLKILGISPNEILGALAKKYDRTALGEVSHNNQWILVSVQPGTGYLGWHLPVKKIGERMVYLDELVTVKKQSQEVQSYYRVNGKNAITLAIYPTKNANTIALSKDIGNKMQELKTNLSMEFQIAKTYDSTEYLNIELDKIYQRAFYTVLILLLFILLVNRSFRYACILVMGIMANLGIAFLLYYILNVEIELYSLAGITISLGLIIDNSIIMLDHIKKQGDQRFFLPILASTLTTIGALSIIYFLDEQYRANLIDFALVIIVNLAVSLFIALFLIPALMKKIRLFPKKERPWGLMAKQWFYKKYSFFLYFLLQYKKLLIVFLILVFGLPVFMLPQKLEQNKTWYQQAYNSTLGNESYSENIRPYIDRYLGGSLRLFSNYVFENAYYGRNEETKLYVTASMEKGATVHQMNQAFVQLENYLREYHNIERFSSTVFSGDYGRMEITFKKNGAAAFPFLLKNRLIRKVLDLGGIDWNVYGVGNGFSNAGGNNEPINFSVEAKGYNYDGLNAWADTLKIALEKHPRIQEVYVRGNSSWNYKPSWRYAFSLDKEKLALARISPLGIIGELRDLTLSKYPDMFLNIQGEYVPIRLKSGNEENFDIWHIKNTPLGDMRTPAILKDFASISQEREESDIYKSNQEYIRQVEFQYIGSGKFGGRFLDEKLEELKSKLPLGYTFKRSNWSPFGGKENNYFFLLLIVLGIVYLICAVFFESLKQPFIILGVVPISFIGVFLTFYFFDYNFDQGGMASFMLLSGITINASIYILNDLALF